MLVELGVVEQRSNAVDEVLAGATVTDVARRYGVARRDRARMAAQIRQQGNRRLADRSSARRAVRTTPPPPRNVRRARPIGLDGQADVTG